jgi:hypothetical protein
MMLALCTAILTIATATSMSLITASGAQSATPLAPTSWAAWGDFHPVGSGMLPQSDHRADPLSRHAVDDDGGGSSAQSTDWSGLVDSGATFTAASGQWAVPAVQPTQAATASATWVGLDGVGPVGSPVIQAGTAQESSGGATSYFAWYEVYPDQAVLVGSVSPGDQMKATIYQDSPGTWTIDMADLTSGQSTSGEVSYSGPGASAEWIEEIPLTAHGTTTLADFGNVQFSNMLIGGSDTGSAVETTIDMVNQEGAVIAYPGALANDAIAITYGQPQTTIDMYASPGSTLLGLPVIYIVSVASSLGVPGGDVVFTDGATALCTATLFYGTGSCTASNAPAGTDHITGTYYGNFDSTSGSTTLVVAGSSSPPPPPPSSPHGYWLVGSDGGIFTFGSAQFHGSTGQLKLNRPVVGITPTVDHEGYWLNASDGGVFAFGDTQFYGSIPGHGLSPAGSGAPHSLNAPIVGMVPSYNDRGYFMVGSDGGVFAFGDAKYEGSCPGIGGCSGTAVSVMPDASGNGYWLVTRSGDIYAFGDAVNHGEPGPQSSPITSAVRTPDGGGYWVLDANGQVFSYGDATNYGNADGRFGATNPATAIFATDDGGGYWVTAANGAVITFGDTPFEGSMAGYHLNGPIIAAAGF